MIPHERYLQEALSFGLLRSKATFLLKRTPIKLQKWKVHFLPPLGIEDNAR